QRRNGKVRIDSLNNPVDLIDEAGRTLIKRIAFQFSCRRRPHSRSLRRKSAVRWRHLSRRDQLRSAGSESRTPTSVECRFRIILCSNIETYQYRAAWIRNSRVEGARPNFFAAPFTPEIRPA